MEFCFVNIICIIIILLLWVILVKNFVLFIMYFIINNKSIGIIFDNLFFKIKRMERGFFLWVFFFNDFFLYILVMYLE